MEKVDLILNFYFKEKLFILNKKYVPQDHFRN